MEISIVAHDGDLAAVVRGKLELEWSLTRFPGQSG